MLKILLILTFLILNGHSIYNSLPLTVYFRPSTKAYIACRSTGEKLSISNFLTASRKICWKPFILLFVVFGFLVPTCSESKTASLLLPNKPNLHAAAIISNNKPSSFNKVCKRRDCDGSCRYASHKSDIKYATRSRMWWLTKWLSKFSVQHYSCPYKLVIIVTEVHMHCTNLRKLRSWYFVWYSIFDLPVWQNLQTCSS